MTRSYSPVADRVVKDHEVGDEDLVHTADGLEGVQVVVGGFGGDVGRLRCELRAQRVDSLAAGLQDRGDRVLGEPVDLEVGVEHPQLVRDRHVTLGVSEADGRRDVESAPTAGNRPGPAPWWRGRSDEVPEQQVYFDRVAGMGQMARPGEQPELSVGELGEPGTGFPRTHGVVASVDHEDRTFDPRQERTHPLLVLEPGRQLGGDQCLCVRVEPPSDGVLPWLRRVRLGQALREEELEEVLVLLDPVVTVPLPPADVFVARLAKLPHRLDARRSRVQREGWSDERHLLDPLRMSCRKQQRSLGTP